jgi:KDO2-lipid IV(A) lauroyltransferase
MFGLCFRNLQVEMEGGCTFCFKFFIMFYLLLPFIYLLSLLPFRALYAVSDFMFFWVYYVIKYRKAVVETNLRNAFPYKSENEIQAISRAYFHFLCDVTLETFKTLTISKKQALKHCRFHNTDLFDRLHKEKRSIIIVLGHFGNWEWAGSSMSLDSDYQFYVIYHPLSDKKFDKLMYDMRSRFGTKLIPMKNTLREMIKNKAEINATAFIADQTPSNPGAAYWTKFMNQDTPVFEGTERIAKMLNSPVVYCSVKRIKRGYYEIYSEMLAETPGTTAPGEITELFTRRLEKEIHEQPETWLWSHRRWKHKRH